MWAAEPCRRIRTGSHHRESQQPLKHAAAFAVVFKEYGALSVVGCWSDNVPESKLASCPMALQRKAEVTVVFAWFPWRSRAARDAGMKAADLPHAFQAFNFHPVLKIHHTAPTHSAMKPRIATTLMPTFTSATP